MLQILVTVINMKSLKLMHVLRHFPLSYFKKPHNLSEAGPASIIRRTAQSVGSTE